MKFILACLTIAVALTVPALAQQDTGSAFRESGQVLHIAPRTQVFSLIHIDRGNLLRQRANLSPRTELKSKGLMRPSHEMALHGPRANLGGKGGFRAWTGLKAYPKTTFRNANGASGTLLINRSAYFGYGGRRNYKPIAAHIPGVDSFVRETLTYHFAWAGGPAGLQVKDPIAKDNWSLRMACTPKLKQESPNRYTAQVACYGRLGWSAQQLPVVVQFTLLGKDKSWKIQGQPTVVSANRLVRPGHSVMANVWAEESAPSAVDNVEAGAENAQVTQ